MSGLVIVAPMSVEAAIVGWRAPGATVRRSGMGPAKAKAAAGELARASSGAMLVLGFCGGLDASSVPGEVIVADELYAAADEGHEEARYRVRHAPELLARVTGLGLKVRSGPIVCTSKIIVGERRAQLHEHGAIAVDMESVWLAQAAAKQRPFGVVRVVLDSPEHELMRLGALAGAFRAARALRRVARALHDWGPAD